MEQINLTLLTLRFLAPVQFLRESAQLFRFVPLLLHDTSCLSCAGNQRRCGGDLSPASPATLSIARRRERYLASGMGERARAAIAERQKFSALLKLLRAGLC